MSRTLTDAATSSTQPGTIGVSVAGTDSVPSFAATFPALNARRCPCTSEPMPVTQTGPARMGSGGAYHSEW